MRTRFPSRDGSLVYTDSHAILKKKKNFFFLKKKNLSVDCIQIANVKNITPHKRQICEAPVSQFNEII